MTLIASNNILMSGAHGRWLSKKEILGVQGFPVTLEHTFGVPCSSFAKRISDRVHSQVSAEWPSRRAACQQAGNSMHTCASGIVALFVMTQISVEPGNFRAQQYNLRRHLACSSQLDQISPKAKARPEQKAQKAGME